MRKIGCFLFSYDLGLIYGKLISPYIHENEFYEEFEENEEENENDTAN